MVGKMRLPIVFVTMAALLAVVLPVDIVLAQQADPSRALPGVVDEGETFNVTVTFTAPGDGFNCISLIDHAPDGWAVIVDKAWCDPHANWAGATGNEASFSWTGTFNKDTTFTVVYEVSAPHDVELGTHTFTGSLGYYLGPGGPYGENIAGDSQVFLPVEFYVIRYIDERLKSPNMLYPGDTFEVFVNWTALLDNFCAIGLTDLAPAGFEVEVNKTWCLPTANVTNAAGNKVEILWYGPYDKGTNFTAKYNVTVPGATAPGSRYFPYDNCSLSWLEYSFREYGPHMSCTMGDREVVVTVPGDIVGETRDVNANPLPGVNVTLYEEGAGALIGDISTPNFTNTANITGKYWLQANKTRYYDINIIDMLHLEDKYIDLTTLEKLAAGYTFDFEGNYGLVPMACSMSYAIKSVNLWICAEILPNPEWGISEWKARESIHSWQFPT